MVVSDECVRSEEAPERAGGVGGWMGEWETKLKLKQHARQLGVV